MKTKYVAGFLFSENEQQVSMVRKARPTWQAGKLNGIGGHIEEGETPEEAMSREFEEETGVYIPKWEQFALLEGERFILYWFRSSSNKIHHVKTKTDEPIRIVSVSSLQSGSFNCISNIPWLITMSLSDSRHDWPYYIEEQSEACFE